MWYYICITCYTHAAYFLVYYEKGGPIRSRTSEKRGKNVKYFPKNNVSTKCSPNYLRS